jgi:hypothetical protein
MFAGFLERLAIFYAILDGRWASCSQEGRLEGSRDAWPPDRRREGS